jgi:hypothetical protein
MEFNNVPSSIQINEGTTQRSIKWPKQLYKEFYKICQIMGNSIAAVTIGLVRDFVNSNRHLLNKEK